MACVPGGNVMAKVIGVPAALAASTSGLSALGSVVTFPLSSALSVIAWPLRLSSQGMTIGVVLEPPNPIVAASGMPMSMWVACRSP